MKKGLVQYVTGDVMVADLDNKVSDFQKAFSMVKVMSTLKDEDYQY
ncbi:hypothetical protein J1P26_14355 [Neobacillus sp. MM2021_6]|nr:MULTISPECIES: hypothetical protein [Bacillaceae]MBO0960882.1 hypothetical protein [Neobacillus sp. MM2021_6]NHC21158.1 hypothetical protein [Bacillus sp. MM2020_4]